MQVPNDKLFFFEKKLLKRIRRLVRTIRKALGRLRERRWVERVVHAEKEKIAKIRGKNCLRVVFLVIHHSTWKTDRLFRLMLNHPRFSPCILVAPDTTKSHEWSNLEVNRTKDYFSERLWEVHVGSREDIENERLLEKIEPDLVFFNNPHGLTADSLNLRLIEKYLCCYIPYHIEIGKYNNGQDQYNRSFHNAVWRIFAPHLESLETYKRIQDRKGGNVVVTGYPGLEMLCWSNSEKVATVWKRMDAKKVIWAPHHTISMPMLPYSNFLKYAETFRSLVREYSGRIQWCFKPHPLLEPKLINHPDWGEERTREYFRFWENGKNTQLELGEYVDLFHGSSALIHDSGSFLAEFLYVDKPVMFLWSSPEVRQYFNNFGIDALTACERGDSEEDVRDFLDDVVNQNDRGREARQIFLTRHPSKYYNTLPSHRILRELNTALERPF